MFRARAIRYLSEKIRSNDILFAQNKKRQTTGNAIERGAKNIRGADMVFSGLDIFPYVMFVSGCDFHSSETIAKRIEMMNMGVPNHYINMTKETTREELDTKVEAIISSISIKKLCNKSIASIFVKAHKYDEMPHGASRWDKCDIVQICNKIIDLAMDEIIIKTSLRQDT